MWGGEGIRDWVVLKTGNGISIYKHDKVMH